MGWQGKPHEPSRAHLVAEVDRLRDALAEAQDVAERLAVQVDRLEQASPSRAPNRRARCADRGGPAVADAIREQLATELDKYRGRVRRAESALADAQAIVDHVEQLEQDLARLTQAAGAVLDAAARADVPAAAFDARLDDLAAVLADLAGAS